MCSNCIAASSWLESAWEAFAAAVARESLDAIRIAYDDTFLSVGEAPVSLHASVYLTGFANERPLAEVRAYGHGSVELAPALADLRADGVGVVVCEGGPSLNASLVEADLVDEWCLTVAPTVVGGDSRRVVAVEFLPAD